MKRALLIAFHYPPGKGSSGIQRTLAFSRYLRESGWEPIVLTAARRAYPALSDEQLGDIPPDVRVIRAFALDSARHLAVRSRYPRFFAYPDRWISWWPAAVTAALRAIRRHRPDVIWSTYPIATAHLIALAVHRLTGIPWLADFRDSMTEEGYPTEPGKRRVYRWIEQKTVSNAAVSVFTAPGALEMYRDRYPGEGYSDWRCILNGYDEAAFADAAAYPPAAADGDRLVLLHSGLLYPSERDPTAFFEALRRLKEAGTVAAAGLEVRLRASGFEREIGSLIEAAGIGDIVTLRPPVSYSEALSELMAADGLLIFQASNCNHQIPAKLYEYIRARRPVLALTDPAGDTAGVMRQSGIDTIVAIDSPEEIAAGLTSFLSLIASNSAPVASDESVTRYSRRSQTRELAALFDSVSGAVD